MGRDSADIFVVGAGPAGAACAWRLASAGASVLLADRCRFPRSKACAGALGGRGARGLLESGMVSAEELEEVTLAVHRRMSCWYRLEHLRTHAPKGPPISIVDRSRFDSLLLARARAAGARVVEGEAVVETEDGCATTDSGRMVRWGFLVVADGASGRIGRRLRGGPAFRGVGVQATAESFRDGEYGLQIHFGLHPWGYGWVFPRGDGAVVGIGGTGGRFSSGGIGGGMPGLLRHAGGTGAEALEGGVIPSGPVPGGLGRGRTFLAGDAAGLVDRISGEGICYAVESGLLVAEAILRGGGRGWLRRRARRGCVGLVRQSRLFAGLLYRRGLQPRAMRRLRDDAKFFQGYWDLVAGRTGYWRMMLHFLKD